MPKEKYIVYLHSFFRVLITNTMLIYYFTGTGNSLWVAKSLQRQLPNSKLSSIISAIKEDDRHIKSDTVGFVFPVHYMGLPLPVKEFFRRITRMETSYTFVVVTGAKPNLGACLSQISKELTKKNATLNAGFHLSMADTNYSRLRSLFSRSRLNEHKVADQKVSEIALLIKRKEKIVGKEFPLSRYYNKLSTKSSEEYSGKFYIDGNCIRCGYCQMVCPVNTISVSGEGPQWKENCISCFACFHFCSQSIIQYSGMLKNKPRYTNPAISIGDMVSQKR